MNYLFAIIAVYVLLMTLLGYRRGLIKSVFSLLAVVVAMLITYYATPYVATYITEHTDLDEALTKHFVTSMEEGFELEQSDTTSRSEQKEILKDSGLPQFIQDVLSANNNKEFYNALGVDDFLGYVAGYFTGVIINLIAYLTTFFIVWILLHFIMKIFDWIAKLPILNGLNRVGGALFGFAKGIVFIYVFFLLITLISDTEWGKTVVRMIEENEFLLWMYQNNPVLNVITDITKQLF